MTFYKNSQRNETPTVKFRPVTERDTWGQWQAVPHPSCTSMPLSPGARALDEPLPTSCGFAEFQRRDKGGIHSPIGRHLWPRRCR